jgi:hypothetical protein
MRKITLSLLIIFICPFITWAIGTGSSVSLDFEKLNVQKDTFDIIKTDNKYIRVDFINPSIFRVRISSENTGIPWSFNEEEYCLIIDKIPETHETIVINIGVNQ